MYGYIGGSGRIVSKAKYKIDNDISNTPEACKPQMLNEEQRHEKYSVEAAEKHYADTVYYKQRKGGDSWFHGRVSPAYRDNYDDIFRKDKVVNG